MAAKCNLETENVVRCYYVLWEAVPLVDHPLGEKMCPQLQPAPILEQLHTVPSCDGDMTFSEKSHDREVANTESHRSKGTYHIHLYPIPFMNTSQAVCKY
jgi:hypothetical protein